MISRIQGFWGLPRKVTIISFQIPNTRSADGYLETQMPSNRRKTCECMVISERLGNLPRSDSRLDVEEVRLNDKVEL